MLPLNCRVHYSLKNTTQLYENIWKPDSKRGSSNMDVLNNRSNIRM
jgi:hypothetical protein